MTRQQKLDFLANTLSGEYPDGLPAHLMHLNERDRLRALMNIRLPKPISERFLKIQDALLQEELQEKTITDASALPAVPLHPMISLWRGDITTLQADAIVNAANSGMLGCFVPCHGCIDNAIHSAAGVQLRKECHRLMEAQGYPEPTGQAKITGAYNLPCRHVIHTVGPIVGESLSKTDCDLLASCYRSCLKLAQQSNVKSIAFSCISTGEFRFPQENAAEIALQTVVDYLQEHSNRIKVIFNVFTERDYAIYSGLLGANQAAKRGN